MFGFKKNENVKVKKLSELEIAKKSANDMTKAVEKNLKIVEKMDKKTYLKYYIAVLEKQIREANRVLVLKKRELVRLSR
jgi:hypothetical protein